MLYKFIPNFKIIDCLDNKNYSIEDFEKEIGVYSATPDFIRNNCGKIANSILDRIPEWYYQEAKKLSLFPNCDVRIHRLYPSDIPAYPGWHCDGEFRETYFSQPDMNRIKVSKHITCTMSTHHEGVSNTQFLNQEFNIESGDSPDFNLWQEVNKELSKKRNKSIFDTKDGDIICFNNWTIHRALPAKIRGWRLFFRMSMWHKPNLGMGGIISKQEQIYKYIGDAGW